MRIALLVSALVVLAHSLAVAQRLPDSVTAPSLASPFMPVISTTTQPEKDRLQWGPALQQSYRFLVLETGFRVAFQEKTRRELGGPFFRDYGDSIAGLHGWGDGDSVLTNYVGHPMQGAISGYIQIQNHPVARQQEFGASEIYWRSRLNAMLWSAAYSTSFELGPLSEASIGNVGMRRGTSGYVDHVITPTGGFGMIIGEDAVDRYLIRKWEDSKSDNWRRFLRVAFNPSRSLANVMRGKMPWFRDTRPLREE